MQSATQSSQTSNKMLWAGRIVSALPVLLLIFSAVVKLMKPADVVTEFARLGYPESLVVGIGVLELLCTVVYLIPRTSVLGAILLTGYLGGATATHVRIGDVFIYPIIGGILVWGGLYFRDARIRALIPLRSNASE
ncbi:MAG TPA: DoxX family protein [Blastocatellia bacterium]|nr:DoxX family protein [Blastocatellia bacterium]